MLFTIFFSRRLLFLIFSPDHERTPHLLLIELVEVSLGVVGSGHRALVATEASRFGRILKAPASPSKPGLSLFDFPYFLLKALLLRILGLLDNLLVVLILFFNYLF